MTITKRLMKDLEWCASDKGREYELSARQAKQILAALKKPKRRRVMEACASCRAVYGRARIARH